MKCFVLQNWLIFATLQDKGNASYKSKDYKAAAGKYHRAILYMKVKTRNLYNLVILSILSGHWQWSAWNPGLPSKRLCWPKPQEAHWPGGGEAVHWAQHLHLQQPRSLPPPAQRLQGWKDQGGDRGGHWAWCFQRKGLVQARTFFSDFFSWTNFLRHGQACIRLADYDKAKESFGKVKVHLISNTYSMLNR